MDYRQVVVAFPFGVAALIIVMAGRAILRGELKSGGGRSRIRTVLRATQPIAFWLEICLYLGVAIFFVLFGLFFAGYAPDWFHDMMLNRPKHV
jgi:hypothetical protein